MISVGIEIGNIYFSFSVFLKELSLWNWAECFCFKKNDGNASVACENIETVLFWIVGLDSQEKNYLLLYHHLWYYNVF